MAGRSRGWTTLGVWLAASLAVASSANASKDTKNEKDPQGAKGKPAAHAVGAPPGHAPAKPAGAASGHAAHGGAATPGHAAHGEPSAARGEGVDPKAHRAHGPEFKGAVAELGERHAKGKLKKAELKQELAALKESRGERRRQHRADLKERWGDGLAQPAAREELRHHERRMARLERMLLLAQTERAGAAKDKLVARIEKLIAHENGRHERKMEQLQAQVGKAPPGAEGKKETLPKQANATPAAAKPEKGAAQ
jgi:hypothetical protein